MNKVILLGRVTKDAEVKYTTGATPMAIARYTLAVNRRFKREGEPDADFINCVAFGKQGEFAEKYLKKGVQISVVGRLQVRSWDDNDGKKNWSTEVIAEEHYFAGGKSEQQEKPKTFDEQATALGFGDFLVDDDADDSDLPF